MENNNSNPTTENQSDGVAQPANVEPQTLGCGGWIRMIAFLAVVGLTVWGIWSLFSPGDGGGGGGDARQARNDAERRVQSDILRTTGIIPTTESAVVYQNRHYIAVGVNYTIEDDFDSPFWTRIVLWCRRTDRVARMSQHWPGVDIRNLTNDQLNQIIVLWELE